MTKTAIITAAENLFKTFSETCNNLDEMLIFKKPGEKWSVAENVQHLVISINIITLAYSLPKFIVRLVGGNPNRNSGTYDELKHKYHQKLAGGGKAGGRFVPSSIQIKYGKQKLMDNWQKATSKFILSLTKNRTEKDLNNYLAKHPLLGRITLRELCYFTIFHTEHHLQAIHKLSAN